MTGGSRKDGYVCARMLSDMVSWPREHGRIRENKYARAPGTFCGLLFLFSVRDATPVAMINDGVLQHMRVGGGAGLGAKYLSRRDASVVGMIGSGGMARTYLDALCCVRGIEKVKAYSPNRENLQRLRARCESAPRDRSDRSGIGEGGGRKDAISSRSAPRRTSRCSSIRGSSRTACDQSDLGRYRTDARQSCRCCRPRGRSDAKAQDRIPTRPSTRVRDS